MEERLARIDVAHAGDDARVHEELLDRHAPPYGLAGERRAGEFRLERFHPEVLEERVAIGRLPEPEHRAEAARIGETQRLAALEAHVDVVMLAGRKALGHHRQAPRHAQVHQKMALSELDQQVFAAAADAEHLLAAQVPREIVRDRPAQVRIAHDRTADSATHEMRQQSAARRFDFRELRHGASLSDVSYMTTNETLTGASTGAESFYDRSVDRAGHGVGRTRR